MTLSDVVRIDPLDGSIVVQCGTTQKKGKRKKDERKYQQERQRIKRNGDVWGRRPFYWHRTSTDLFGGAGGMCCNRRAKRKKKKKKKKRADQGE